MSEGFIRLVDCDLVDHISGLNRELSEMRRNFEDE
jgi:hypothetical protein